MRASICAAKRQVTPATLISSDLFCSPSMFVCMFLFLLLWREFVHIQKQDLSVCLLIIFLSCCHFVFRGHMSSKGQDAQFSAGWAEEEDGGGIF